MAAVRHKWDVIVAMTKNDRALRMKAYYRRPRKCLLCKKPIPYDKSLWCRGGAKYCSRSCGSTAGNHKRALARGITCCLRCYKPIVGKVYRLNLKYCSYKCYRLHQWKEFVAKLEAAGVIDESRIQRKYLVLKHGWQCMRCKRRRWEGKPIVMDVHHKNKNHDDNRIENLALLCVMCHYYIHRREHAEGTRIVNTHRKFAA